MRIRTSFFFAAVFGLTIFGASICYTQTPNAAPNKPAVAPVRPVTDDYYGTKIVDNYRYMENLKDPEVQEWFKNQNDYTRAMLASIPGREKFMARIHELAQSDPVIVRHVTRRPGDLYFYTKLLGDDDVSKLYMRRGLTGEEKLLVDPEKVTLSPSNQGNGKNVISDFTFSQDGKYMAVRIIRGGAENDTELHVFDLSSGRETGDVILHAWGQDARWLPDNRSFTYTRYQDHPDGTPAAELKQKETAYLHVLGRDPKNDPAVLGFGVSPLIGVDPDQNIDVFITPNSDQVIGDVISGGFAKSNFYIEPLEALGKTNTAWRTIAEPSDKVRQVAIHGDDLYLLTYKNASHYKILRTSARNPDLASAEVVVPSSEAIVRSMQSAQDALYVLVDDAGLSRILRVPFGPKPKVETVPLPFEGTATVEDTDSRLPGFVLGFASLTAAYRNYIYDPHTKKLTDTKFQPLGPHDHNNNMEAVRVKVKSYDGTLVPLSIVYPKGLKLDGSNPTELYGYGAYGISFSSSYYDPVDIAWAEKGGIFATCGVRGGGEYGEEWHLAGKGATKPNTWRDFIACAEYLIDKKYTSAKYLAVDGGSAGGILVGRAITERPDLFGAAIIEVGIVDTLRYETGANGPPNIPEFGSTKTEEGFKALYAMSAYHHVKDGTSYPAVLLTTGMNDPRVDPWEPGKMAARLQAATSSGKPILLSVDYESGHGSSTEKGFEESYADMVSFMLWQFGNPDFQPKKHPDSVALSPPVTQGADSDRLGGLLKDVPELPVERIELDIHPSLTFEKISAVSTDKHGNIYIIHRPSNGDPIVVLDPEGKFIRSWGKGMFTMPHGIRIDPDGNVWTLDAHTSTIDKFTPEGKKLLEISVGGVPDSTLAFCGATDIAFAKSGHIFVSDGYCNARVIEYDALGKKLGEWGKHGSGPGEFKLVHSIAMSPDGTLYVADRENGRIEWFDQRGKFLGQWQYGGHLYSVAFSPAGDLYAGVLAMNTSVDNAFNVIKIDVASGKILGKIPARSHELAVAPDGTLLPASLDSHLILLRPRENRQLR